MKIDSSERRKQSVVSHFMDLVRLSVFEFGQYVVPGLSRSDSFERVDRELDISWPEE
jgi:hypothetical protein